CGALTSARRCRSARTAARSILSIASASGASAAADDRFAAANRNAAAIRPFDVGRITVSPRRVKSFRLRSPVWPGDSGLAARRTSLESQHLVDLALPVGKLVEPHPDLLEHRQVQVRQRRRLRVLDMTSTLDPARATAGDDDRQVDVIMD